MANYKVPRVVEIVDALPLNATGKVMKETLREHAAAHTGASVPMTAGPNRVDRLALR